MVKPSMSDKVCRIWQLLLDERRMSVQGIAEQTCYEVDHVLLSLGWHMRDKLVVVYHDGGVLLAELVTPTRENE